ncbi:MAG: FtsX-like permease family protein [Clostridium sp.]|uniref:FtsX-like permease family protein n=1 Tax=Clostridium sp. TaxID=1506 RepID=UPI003F31BEE7
MKKYDYIIKAYTKKYKRQKIYTIVGLVLACILFTTISYVLSIEKEIRANEVYQNIGYYDIAVQNVNENTKYKLENNIYVEGTAEIKEKTGAEISNTNKNIDLYSVKNETIERIFKNQVKLIKGKLPLNNNEVILAKNALDNLNENIGGKITIDNKSYKIVGVYKERDGYSTHMTIGEGITDEGLETYNQTYMIIKFKSGIQSKEIMKIIKMDKLNLLRDNYDYNLKIEEIIGRTAIGVISILSTIILMYGSINVGMIKKEKYYSLLRCIGITKNKLIYLILKENLILGAVSIPLGVFLGYIFVSCNKVAIAKLLSYGIVNESIIEGIHLNEGVILQGIVIGVCMLLISSILPIIRLTKKTPIEGLKEIKIKKNRKNKILKKLSYNSYLAYRNVRRNKRRFRLSIIALSGIGIAFSLISGYYYFAKKYNNLEGKSLNGNIVGFVDNDSGGKVNELENYIVSIVKDKAKVMTTKKVGDERDYSDFIEINFDVNNLNEEELQNIKNKAENLNLSFINKKLENENENNYLNALIKSIYLVLGGILLTMIINMINSNYANMELRKKEFASIISMGAEKKRLKRILMLEGVITWGIAGIITSVISIIGIIGINIAFNMQGVRIEGYTPYLIMILGVCLMLPLNLIITLLPFRGLKIDNLAKLMKEE